MTETPLRRYTVSVAHVLVEVEVEATDVAEARHSARETIRQNLEAELADENLIVNEVTS